MHNNALHLRNPVRCAALAGELRVEAVEKVNLNRIQ
jgi:hypothetical protein